MGTHVRSRRAACRCADPCACVTSDLASFLLLAGLIALYMLLGAAIFSALERPAELQAYRCWGRRLAQFSHEHRVSADALKHLLHDYEEASAAGVRTQPRRPRWDFSGAFYFVATVVSTIGFGMAAPSTISGKVLLIFYGLIGCSATLLFFNLFLERVITLLSFLMRWCRARRQCGAGVGTGTCADVWKPSVYYVALFLAAVALLVACAASGLYAALEGWSYMEALYFCFVAFSTMGFGDMVSGQQTQYAAGWVYQITNCLTILLGVCCTYSLFSVISIIMKQGLHWTLGKLRGIPRPSAFGPARPRRRLLRLCCCSSVDFRGNAPVQQEIQITAQCRGRRWSCHVVMSSLPRPSGYGCRCEGVVVATVSGEMLEAAGGGERAERPPAEGNTPTSRGSVIVPKTGRHHSLPGGLGASPS